MTNITAIPVNLVTGLPGAGKTEAITRLLAQRSPEGLRWAVLTHDAAGAAAATAAGGIAREAAVGCPCCMGVLPLRTALVDLIRKEKPDRLLIEPHGAAHTDAILALLREPGLAGALDLHATLCVTDTLAPVSPIGRAQIGTADLVVWRGDADRPPEAMPMAHLSPLDLERPAEAAPDPLGLRRQPLPKPR